MLRGARFEMDGTGQEGQTYEGWTDGSDWNGFANPLFDRETAMRAAEAIADAYNGEGEWRVGVEATDDEITLSFEATNGSESYEESVPLREIDGLALFDFGHGWTWLESER